MGKTAKADKVSVKIKRDYRKNYKAELAALKTEETPKPQIPSLRKWVETSGHALRSMWLKNKTPKKKVRAPRITKVVDIKRKGK